MTAPVIRSSAWFSAENYLEPSLVELEREAGAEPV